MEQGIPSPIIRVDMAPVTKSEVIKESIYEVEARPGGIGLMLSLAALKRINQCKKALSKCRCKGLVNLQSSIYDDVLVAKILGIPYYENFPGKTDGPYWIRSDQRIGSDELEKVSLVPIRLDGDKTYLVRLNMAEILVKERLNWSAPFVAKPLRGSRMEGVEIYFPNSFKKNFGSGISTKSRILRTISGTYIVQKFIFPKREEIDGVKGWTIWRLFFCWGSSSDCLDGHGKYQFMGGLWNWRPTLRVHGASDAVFGLIDV